MKRILLAGATLLALTAAQPTLAADAPVYKGPVPVAVAPVFNWSGFYVGGHLGGVWSNFRWSDSGAEIVSLNPNGWLGGAQIGYLWQTGPWVLGLEASYSAADASATVACPNPAFACRSSVEHIWMIGPRVGYAAGSWLLYLTGGYANIRTSSSATPLGGGFAATMNHDAWAFGGGLEFLLSANFIFGAEYIHYEGTAVGGVGSFPLLSIRPRLDVARVRLSFKFP